MQKAVANQQNEWSRLLTTGQMELLVLVLAAAPLLFPHRFPQPVTLIALSALALPFAIRYRRTGSLLRYSHANWPVLGLLLVFLPMSLIVSPLPMEVSWPRFTTLAWSISLFCVLCNWPEDVGGSHRGRTRFTLPTKLFLLLGVVVAVAGLLGMRSVDKLFYLPLPDLALGWTIFGDGLATNEVGGALTLFVPFAAALFLGAALTHRTTTAVVAGALTLLFLAVMVLSQSRTALFSTAMALALVGGLLIRPGWKWIAAGFVTAGILLLVASQTGLLDRFVFAGAASWDSVVGPRLDVWQQGGFALRDFAIWGTGLGMFGRLTPLLYPFQPIGQAKILEDAHNLYLQTMLDFGILGGLVFAAILAYAAVVLVRLMRRRRSRTMGRAWAVGLLAALIAHLIYSLTDAVAVGTLAGVPLWFLLGMTMARTHDTKPQLNPVPVTIVASAVLVLLGGLAWTVYPTNQAARLTADALLRGTNKAEATLAVATAAETRCDLHWHEGLLHHAQGELVPRDAAWVTLLGCTDRFARFMPILAPDDATLAQQAIEHQPGSPVGYFWLADLVTPTDPAAAIKWYQQGLKVAPEDGRRWGYLGNLLVETDPDAALDAYLHSCHNGDPGANGCLAAGSLAERQGDLEDAIVYYRLSKYRGSIEQAERLERQVAGQE